MKQLIQSFKTGEITVEEVPAPIVRHGGLLVATRVSLVSAGTERQIVDLGKKSLLGKAKSRPDLVKKVFEKARADGWIAAIEAARSRLDQPFALGYSCAGVVKEVGPGVTDFARGDRVACGGQGYASHAELNFVPRNLCVKLADSCDFQSGAFVTVGAIALQSVRQADVRLGETVGVIGLGLLGHIVAQLLKASGATVLGSDIDPVKVELAKELGCDEAVVGDPRPKARAMTGGRGLDSVIIAASTTSDGPIEMAAEMCRMKGRVVVLGLVGMNVPRKLYYERELDLRMSMSYGPGRYDPNYEEYGHDYPYAYVRWTENRNMQAFLQMVATDKVNVARLVTHRFTIADALGAYELLEGKRQEPFLGIVLTYEEPKDGRPAATRIAIHASPSAVPPAAGQAVIGVVGAGNFAQGTLLPNLSRTPKARLRGLADARTEVAKHVAAKMGFEYCVSDFRELLADPEIDTIFITTRHNTHAKFVCDSLTAGKNVFVEKPLCVSEEQLQEVTEAYESQQGRCRLMVGFNRRFAPLVVDLRKAFAECNTPLVMTYVVNAGLVPRSSWVQSAEEGGGRIIGEVCHFVDTLGYLAGAPVTEVSASAIGMDREDVVRLDNSVITLSFADGSIGSILYTSLGDKAFGKESIKVFGAGRVGVLDNFRRLSITRSGRTANTRRLRQHKGHLEEVQAFVRAIADGQPSPIAFDGLCGTTRVTFRILEVLAGGTETKER